MGQVVRVSMFPVGEKWTVIVEYEHHAESRDFASRANAEWYREIMESKIKKKENN